MSKNCKAKIAYVKYLFYKHFLKKKIRSATSFVSICGTVYPNNKNLIKALDQGVQFQTPVRVTVLCSRQATLFSQCMPLSTQMHKWLWTNLWWDASPSQGHDPIQVVNIYTSRTVYHAWDLGNWDKMCWCKTFQTHVWLRVFCYAEWR